MARQLHIAKEQRQGESLAADIIKHQDRRAQATVIKFNNPHICQCLVCGALLQILTHVHAEKHGYKTKEQLIRAGKVRYLTSRAGWDFR